MKRYDSKGLEWLRFLKALVSIRDSFQLGKVQYFPSAFYEWLDRIVLESESPAKAIHKNNNKTKQTHTKNFLGPVWSHWGPEAGKTCWQLKLQLSLKVFKGFFGGLKSMKCCVEGQLVELLWHILGRKPELALFQTLSFLSLKCQDLIHGKLGELAALSEDFIELQCVRVTWMQTARPKIYGDFWAGENSQPLRMSVDFMWFGSKHVYRCNQQAKKENKTEKH